MPSTILVVDDDEFIHTLVQEIFAKHDHSITVLTASNCDEGLAVIATTDVDCVFLDQRMNKQSGTECLRKLRQQLFPGAIIIFTGFLEEHVVSEAIRYGADDFVLKDTGLGMSMIQSYESAMARRAAKVAMRERVNTERTKLENLANVLEAAAQTFRDFLMFKCTDDDS